ncbi:hypothetical protein RRG08_050083 [Elysia crispata]|uniref:Uncharacterized protein n=1 Tax=Elysia crispata TaxID=231223 RepID=A0AAE1AMU8_9GAST|nr:hypothetical protein RRG08_050083 [Elysia crispata]
MEGNEGQRLEIKIGEGSKERLGIKRGSREDSLEIYKKRQRGKNDGKTKKEKKREARLTRALPLYASYEESSRGIGSRGVQKRQGHEKRKRDRVEHKKDRIMQSTRRMGHGDTIEIASRG